MAVTDLIKKETSAYCDKLSLDAGKDLDPKPVRFKVLIEELSSLSMYFYADMKVRLE